ncbi:TPA: hypothetical protein ACVU4T_000623 [Vibrio parahaemolyticus]|uniref:DNA lyase n=1 Tax=Vibrio olivae TaxID=1243002 RepID=A0ABV5HPZ4_9VIBR|nr:hypothetical protein [Vibrio fluvialis]HDM8217186.1 hypothetical protein [Vibrio campbellii]
MNAITPNLEATIEILKSARILANYAKEQGLEVDGHQYRPTYDHMGAILADSVLQAGLNYTTVVRPRVLAILNTYSEMKSTCELARLLQQDGPQKILNWTHSTKLSRFENLVSYMLNNDIHTASDLKNKLMKDDFCSDLQSLNGIGPKTVDYMKCLVGIDSIAVDRHIRSFAKSAGIENSDYTFLKDVFCSAADLLTISRRGFDSWVWRTLSVQTSPQQSLF